MPGFTLAQLNDAGYSTGNFFKKVANAARDGACSLYKSYPGFMTGSVVFNSPASAFSRGVWDSLCDGQPSGLPPPPTPPFQGGQCECDLYSVTVAQVYNGVPYYSSRVLRGKIGGLSVVFDSARNSNDVFITCGGDRNSPCIQGTVTAWFIDDPASGKQYRIHAVTRLDGAADTCGDPPPQFPDKDVLPPPGSLTNNRDITYNDGTDFTLPFFYAPISLDGAINVRVGEINFNFNADGVEFNFGDSDAPGVGRVGDALDNLSDDFNDFRNDWSDFRDDWGDFRDNPPSDDSGDDSPPPPTEDDYNFDEKSPDDPKDEQGIEGLRYVKIDLEEIPKYVRVQYGITSPNVVYAGWFEFRSGGHCFPREPIHFSSNIFRAPPGADGYAYTLTNDVQGYATVVTKKSEETNA